MTDKDLATMDVTPAAMIKAAIEQGTAIDQLSALLELQERWEAGEARKAYNRAVAAFKANPPRIHKDKQVSFGNTQYRHATLDHIVDAVTPALHEQGLSHRWEVRQDEGLISVACILSHEGGHFERVEMAGPADSSGSKNKIQQVGSTVTYLQRYTLMAILGLAAGEDDDAGAPGPADAELITDEQALELEARANDHDLLDRFLDWLEAKTGERSVASLPANQYQHAARALTKVIKASHE